MTKRVFAWLFAVATLALVLYVRNEYNIINGVNLGPPAKVSQASAPAATAPRPEKPGQAKDEVADEAFMGLPFGSDEKAIVAKFGSQLKKLETRENFAYWYVDYIIPGFDMDGVPMDVHFQMDKDSHLLTQVLLRKMADDKPLGVYAEDFKALTMRGLVMYGMPEATEEGDRKSNYFREERKWTRARANVDLSRTQKSRADGSTSEMITLRFTQPG
jgi:hypothetical protein